MTGAQIVFWSIQIGLPFTLTPVLYPGVKKRAASRRDSLLAALMASALFSTFVALAIAATVHAVGVALG